MTWRSFLPSPCSVCGSWWCVESNHCPVCTELTDKFIGCRCDRTDEARRAIRKLAERDAELDRLADKIAERLRR